MLWGDQRGCKYRREMKREERRGREAREGRTERYSSQTGSKTLLKQGAVLAHFHLAVGDIGPFLES